jgi:HlyD family secretion protein
MKRRTTVLAAAGACVIGGLAAWAWFGSQSGIQYRTATVGHGDIDVTISATGNPNAVVTVQVGSQVSGNIQALFADFNTKVTKGELIAQIDPAPFQTRVNQAQASVEAARAAVANSLAVVQQALAGIQAAKSALAAAQANVVKAQTITDDAKVKVDRRVVMFAKGADAKKDLETAQTTYRSAVADHDALLAQQQAVEDSVKVAQAQLNVANSLLTANQAQVRQYTAALETAQIDLRNTKITAPVNGVVVSRNVDVGQTVAASLAAPTLVPDCARPHEDAGGYERVGGGRGTRALGPARHLHRGCVSRADVRGHGHPDSPGAHQRRERDHYDAVIGISNTDLKLFPGMTANVKILVNQRPNALKVPNAALRYHPASETAAASKGTGKGAASEKAVWILNANKAPQRVVVTTGESDGASTEVLTGALKDGDRVIVAAFARAMASSSGGSPGGGRGPGF